MQLKGSYTKKINFYSGQSGFTIVEIILVILIIGLASGISRPLFDSFINKVKQKEATLIVNRILKAVKANYALEAFLPEKIGPLDKFASFKKCISDEVEIKGHQVCNSENIINTDKNDSFFYSPSGNYKVEFKTNESINYDIFQVRAIPIGSGFAEKGSSVVGCFNPILGKSIVKEYSFSNKGKKDFISCLTAYQISEADKAKVAEEEAREGEILRIAEEARFAEELKTKQKCIRWNPRSSKINESDCWEWGFE